MANEVKMHTTTKVSESYSSCHGRISYLCSRRELAVLAAIFSASFLHLFLNTIGTIRLQKSL